MGGGGLLTLYILDNNEHDLGINAKFVVILAGSVKLGVLALGMALVLLL
jgi:hypothetical protein